MCRLFYSVCHPVCKLFQYLCSFEYGESYNNRSIVEKIWFYLFPILFFSLNIVLFKLPYITRGRGL